MLVNVAALSAPGGRQFNRAAQPLNPISVLRGPSVDRPRCARIGKHTCFPLATTRAKLIAGCRRRLLLAPKEVDMQCAAHPKVETELTCGKCDKAICPRCLVQGPVGARCPECANIRRIPTYNMSAATFWRAGGAALGAGVALGVAWWIFNPLSYFFYGVIVGIAVGYATGELVSLATNRKAGPPLQALAVAGVVLAYGMRVALLFAFSNWVFRDLRVDLGGLIALGIAGFIAAGRLR